MTTIDCKDCPASILNEWRVRGLKVRAELRRHQLSDRERRIAEVILDKSFGWGRPCVVVPQLKFFTSLTGISVPHVHEAIAGLHLKRIIRVVMVKGQANYCVREDTDNWKVSPRVSQDAINETVSLLRELNELPPLPRVQEDLPNFRVRTVTKNKANSFPESVITGGNTQKQEVPEKEITEGSSDEHLPYLS